MLKENPFSNYLQIGESLKPFQPKDPFRTYSWRSINIISEISRTEAFYVLRTNVRLSRFLESKKLEHFLIGLDRAEFAALLDVPGVLNDRIFIDLLKSKVFLLSSGMNEAQARQILLERVARLQSLLGLTVWSFHLLNTYLGNLKYELFQTEERIRKVKKYSGYIKTPSAAGSKRGLGPKDFELETTDPVIVEERDFVPYFTSPTEDYSLLGFNAESPLYTFLIRSLKERKELPNSMKHLVFYEIRNF